MGYVAAPIDRTIMNRTTSLGLLLALLAGPATAQRAAPGEGADHSETLGSGLSSVNWGTMGLNVGVSAGEDGVLLVDDQEEAGVPRLKAEIAKLSDKPVRLVINTHWHFDHVGGNAEFAKAGAATIAHVNTRNRLMAAQVNPVNGGTQKAFSPEFWPQLTFEDSLRIHFNGDDIDLIHVPNAHTDSDVIVKFHKADVLFAADLFNNGDYTRIDGRGGSLDGMIAAYRALLPTLDDAVKVVPGRGRVGTKKDLADYLSVMIALRARMTKLIRDGKTLEECVAAKPTADFDAQWGNGPIRPDQLVEELYADLKPKAR
jgi:glyoxylase-like metal-dependent hydrolase (beta-lactamase superfamily II)